MHLCNKFKVIFQQQQNATGIITYYWTLKKEDSKLTVVSYSIVKYNNLPYIYLLDIVQFCPLEREVTFLNWLILNINFS
jgi:hypothetical protein